MDATPPRGLTMQDPFGGGFDPRMFENVPLFRELAKVMSWTGGPVNWDLARQTAEAVVSSEGGGPAPLPAGSGVGFTAAGDRESDQFAEAVRVGELWLDQVTALPAMKGPTRAYRAADWLQQACTSEGLGVYVEPVAEGMSAALSKQLPQELAGNLGGPIGQAMRSMGAMLYGVQIGTVAGHLSGQLLGSYDLGVPTMAGGAIGTVGANARRFAEDYAFDNTEFSYWMALREAAHRRQYAGVTWLRQHVRELIRRFAAEADFDAGSMLDQLGGMGMDPSSLGDPESLRAALEGPDAFHVEPTTAQKQILETLQALVAFTEAWVDTVVRAAAGDKLTALPRIEEAIRRRRAEKGQGERFLEQLVGLDLKPGDVRQGQQFCEAVIAARGQEGLDRVWRAPEHLPQPAELAEPSRWLVRMAAVELEEGDGSGPSGP
jgi:putative hydrolase